MKVIKEDPNTRKEILCAWTGTLYVMSKPIPSKFISKFTKILINILRRIFMEFDKHSKGETRSQGIIKVLQAKRYPGRYQDPV